jgi:hypothetical protein
MNLLRLDYQESPYQLYLNYKETEEIIRDDFCRSNWSGYSESRKHFHLKSVARKGQTGYHSCEKYNLTEEAPNKAFLVIVRYTDGGTFGCTHGYWTLRGVFKTRGEAEGMAKSIRDESYEEVPGQQYLAWTGYFASLEDVEIHAVVIE